MSTVDQAGEWQRRVDAAWDELDSYEGREEEFRARIDALAGELPEGDPAALFERASAWDSTGHSDKAVPLYQAALDGGLAGYKRRRALVQMCSSLRNVGRPEVGVELLTAELAVDPSTLDEPTRGLGDAIAAALALCLTSVGREREAVSVALGALAPHLPRYQRSMGNYARLLVQPEG